MAEKPHWPFLQGFRQQGVVGKGEGLAGDIPRLFPLHGVLVDQKAHQLGDGDGGVGVVELHGKLVVKALQAVGALPVEPHHVLQRAGDEEVLLLQP